MITSIEQTVLSLWLMMFKWSLKLHNDNTDQAWHMHTQFGGLEPFSGSLSMIFFFHFDCGSGHLFFMLVDENTLKVQPVPHDCRMKDSIRADFFVCENRWVQCKCLFVIIEWHISVVNMAFWQCAGPSFREMSKWMPCLYIVLASLPPRLSLLFQLRKTAGLVPLCRWNTKFNCGMLEWMLWTHFQVISMKVNHWHVLNFSGVLSVQQAKALCGWMLQKKNEQKCAWMLSTNEAVHMKTNLLWKKREQVGIVCKAPPTH